MEETRESRRAHWQPPKRGSVHLVAIFLLGIIELFGTNCGTPSDPGEGPAPTDNLTNNPTGNNRKYEFANGCYALAAAPPGGAGATFLTRTATGEAFTFSAEQEESGSRFRLRPADLGTYLFHDEEAHYLAAEKGGAGELALQRTPKLLSDILLLDDSYLSPAEWDLEDSAQGGDRFHLRHHATGLYLTTNGSSEDEGEAAEVTFHPRTGCAAFPELTLDADGAVKPRKWEDGAVFGIVETHAHLFTNFGFGGGGIFHGAPFHRLGVEHALPSCKPYHGPEGRKDVVGFTMDGGGVNLDAGTLISLFLTGSAPGFNHHTEGYPEFTDWPNSWASSTHQTMYYRWIERAYLAGLRLLVQHATSNSVLCDLVVAMGIQDVRYSCNDMVAIDRIIEEVFNLERYIDAQLGGPGRGWFRIVRTPAEARQVIAEGKLAVILGIEVSNLFDCFLTPPPGTPVCDAERVREQLDRYYARGIRAIFPVHKYDNAFSPGDGHEGVIELGNFINTGHYSNFVKDCPDLPTVFDGGNVTFGGLNRPRDDYLAPAPLDMSGFIKSPLLTLLPFLPDITAPKLEGDYCQKAGLPSLGETLLVEMMKRGIIVELDHLPRRSYARAFELLQAHDYPAAGTHGNTNRGLIYRLGGISKADLGRCSDPDRPGAMGDSLRSRVQEAIANGGYPALGFGFDLNGFASGPGPRFGADSHCGKPQANPITYPFPSYAGDITFQEPHLAKRTVDFNTEGMIHIGLLPELIEDTLRNGVTEKDLEPLFRSAEGYLRMWEKAEARAAALAKSASR